MKNSSLCYFVVPVCPQEDLTFIIISFSMSIENNVKFYSCGHCCCRCFLSSAIFFFYNAYFPVVDSHPIVLRQVQPNPTHLFFPWRAPHHSANSSLVWFFPLSKCITVSPNSQLPITFTATHYSQFPHHFYHMPYSPAGWNSYLGHLVLNLKVWGNSGFVPV